MIGSGIPINHSSAPFPNDMFNLRLGLKYGSNADHFHKVPSAGLCAALGNKAVDFAFPADIIAMS